MAIPSIKVYKCAGAGEGRCKRWVERCMCVKYRIAIDRAENENIVLIFVA